MAKKSQSAQQLLVDIEQDRIKPLYFLMGEEPYYIDLISNTLVDKLLDEAQKDFDLSVLYGKDVDLKDVIVLARQYPMLAPKKVVWLKEAQEANHMDDLIHYIHKPMPTTVLIINYKNGTLDKRKKLVTELEEGGFLFESKKMFDSELPDWIEQQLKKKGFFIDVKAVSLLAEFVGNDLTRLEGELNKLLVALPKEEKKITSTHIEQFIGISKDYNEFELLDAVARKDVLKANRIAVFFSDNSKNHPFIRVVAMMSNFFINLMYYHYLVDKSSVKVASELGVPYGMVKLYESAAKYYGGTKTMHIIHTLRQFDAMSKGIGARANDESELLKELLFRIMH
jgi:DNA polymerase-3 subunit delta